MSIWTLAVDGQSPILTKLWKLRYLIIDEADRMTEKGHFKEFKNIIEHIYEKVNKYDILKAEEEEENKKVNIEKIKAEPLNKKYNCDANHSFIH